jgi:curved DNA-binding protein CbpA
MQESLYDVLGLSGNAGLEEIRAAYKNKILSYHPDKSSSSDKIERFQRIKEAWTVLSNLETRKNYDEALVHKNLRLRDTIKFSDLIVDSEETNSFRYICRCGCTLNMSSNDIRELRHRDVGEIVIFCDDCSSEIALSL